ncbi:MAG TPA: hypothetical protein VFQ65_33535 [Kofleriaceae bacterium]|nr:hypothetical protein [Kofleriaceae bacterium]
MDDYGASPFQIMRLLGPMMVVGPLLLWMLISGPFVLYPIARWRAHREAVVDPQLGLKTALEYFRMLAFQLGLLGCAIVVFAMFSKMPGDDKGDAYRVGFGLFVPAAILFAAHVAMLTKTNEAQYAGPRRLFGGYNLVITGLLGMTAFMLVFQAMFAKGSTGDFGRFAGASLVVYGGAWAACGIRFLRLVRDDVPPPQAPQRDAAPPPAVTPPPSTGLPSLGGGSYPPIER